MDTGTPSTGISPLRLITTTAVALFVTELAIMAVFSLLPDIPELPRTLIDASLLTSVILPILYFSWYKPLLHNIHARARAEEEARRGLLRDSVTGLPNITLLSENIHSEIEIARRENGAFSLALLDVRRFRDINDALGHHNGDELLKKIAERLLKNLRKSDTVARLGADEFVIVLRGMDRNAAILAAEKIMSIVEAPFFLDGNPIEVETRCGIASFPEHGESATTLLQKADGALQNAKASGENYSVHTKGEELAGTRRIALFRMLRTAIHSNELVLHYQPKMDIASGHIHDVEALVRWRHPERGMIPPGEFIPLAEQTNLIKPLTAWLIGETLRQITIWDGMGLRLRVAINLSARNLTDESLPEHMRDMLARWNVTPDRIVGEITESAVMANPIRAGEVLEGLKKTGIALSLDDFGTGYSSLTYLRRIPAAELKIDRSFVQGVASNASDEAIVRTVVDLAHNLRLKVVAEGVETETVMARLRELGCDAAQGYYISRPLAPEDLERWLARGGGR